MFQPIIDAVNVGPITVAILSIAAMLAAVLVVIRGVRFVLGLIGGSAGGHPDDWDGGTGGWEPPAVSDADWGHSDEADDWDGYDMTDYARIERNGY